MVAVRAADIAPVGAAALQGSCRLLCREISGAKRDPKEKNGGRDADNAEDDKRLHELIRTRAL